MKKIRRISYIILIIFSLSILSISYTSSFFSDIEFSRGNIFSAGVGEWDSCPPYNPINPLPNHNALSVDINPTLSVYVSDPNNDTMTVSFYNANDHSLIDFITNVQNASTVAISWPNLDFGTTYEWYVICEDYEGPVQSDTWNFTTISPPDILSLISPSNGSSDIDLSTILKVHVFNQDTDNMTVSFYDASNNQLIGEVFNVSSDDNASVMWDSLEYSHIYNWYAIVNDSVVENKSDTWSFTTKSYPIDDGGTSGGGSSGGTSPPPPNSPPTADTSGPYYGNVSETILFNGSSSFDSDGTITSYYWDFGDGTNTTDINATATNEYIEIGTYNVTLTVTDDDGDIDSSVTTVTINSLLKINNVLATPITQDIGGFVNITCDIVNSSSLVDVILNITYPDGNFVELSIYQNYIENTNLFYYNQSYNLHGAYEFYIWVNDTENKKTISEKYYFLIIDSTPPVISNVAVMPDEQIINGYVNISATVTDNIDLIKYVYLKIINPDSSETIVEMIHINGTDTFYFNSTYSEIGDYSFFILATDTDYNVAISNTYPFLILDLQPPEIFDNTADIAYKNNSFTFNATVTDNNIVSDVFVEYWYDSENHTNISMTNSNEAFWELTIEIPYSFDILHYILHAKDPSNNWVHTEVKSITILENT